MNGNQFLALGAFDWLGILIVLLTLFVLADAFAGHFRSGFENKSQYCTVSKRWTFDNRGTSSIDFTVR